MRPSPYFAPVVGDINFLNQFFGDLLPVQARAQIAQPPDAASTDEDASAEVSEFVFATMNGDDDARDHNVAGGKPGSGMSDVVSTSFNDDGLGWDGHCPKYRSPEGAGPIPVFWPRLPW